MEKIGSQAEVMQPDHALDQMNLSYWRKVIDMAAVSGRDEREWCRANGVAINLFEKYRELFREESEVRPEQHTLKRAVIGKNRERYVEITRDGKDAYIEEISTRGCAIREPDHRKSQEAAANDDAIPAMRIEYGKNRISIYDGISEWMLDSIVKAVMANA